MGKMYSPETRQLSKFLAEIADPDSTIVIPDLQRPYIWNPSQVSLLVDSIFKKWPFGSLLCWSVKNSTAASEIIPFRPFWQEFVRGVPERTSRESSVNCASNNYLMILDGQQRMQSLLLALGGETWGFTLTDREWRLNLEGREENIDSKHWSTGCLCLDLPAFMKEYARCGQMVASIEVGKCIAWTVLDEVTGLSSSEKKQVLPLYSSGNYLRFSRLWKAVKQPGYTPEKYVPIVRQLGDFLTTDKSAPYLKPLSEFMCTIADVKEYTEVTCFVVADFDSTNIESKQLYNSAIVNIFARLNSAGRILSAQDIILAWLKTGWREASTGDKGLDCGTWLDQLLSEMNDHGGSDTGLQITMDDLVDVLSMIWSIVTRTGAEGEEVLLTTKDLVDGDVIKSIGKTTYENRELIEDALTQCKETFEHRKLNECFSRSYFAFNILCGWVFLTLKFGRTLQGRKRESECRFDLQVNEAFDAFIDRWFVCTLLAETWSRSTNYPNYVRTLCATHAQLRGVTDPLKVEEALKKLLTGWISQVEPDSLNRIQELRAFSRTEVIRYKNMLWLWNRLEMERWREAQKPMKRKSAVPKLEVDHAVPVAIWQSMVEASYPKDKATDETGKERPIKVAEMELTRSQLLSWINVMGNCSLLLRSHNRSKKDEQFGDFLADVHPLPEQRERFEKAMSLPLALLKPTGRTIAEIVLAGEARTKEIKGQLMDYIQGKAQRCDVE